MVKILIDIMGTVLHILVIMVFFETFWPIKPIKKRLLICGTLSIAIVDVAISVLLLNTVILPLASTAVMFILSFFYDSSITSKILITSIISAITFTLEILVSVVVVYILAVPIEQVQGNMSLYMMGVVLSRLLPLLMTYIFRIAWKKDKQETDKQFNLLMASMPIQSIIICFIIYGYSVSADRFQTTYLGTAAIIVSLLLVFVTMIILNNQHKAMAYKKDYELSQLGLKLQIEHYQNLHRSQREVRSIRHDISDKLVAISGFLEKGMVQEAIDHINGINDRIRRTEDVTDTGIPPVDAILSAKIAKSKESGIQIVHKIHIENAIVIDQFDIAILLANALDNAIEGITRSKDVDRVISLDIKCVHEYISILVENYTSEPVSDDFRSSKADKEYHGFGIAHMKAIALKHNGDIHPSFDPATGKFMLTVLLRNQA